MAIFCILGTVYSSTVTTVARRLNSPMNSNNINSLMYRDFNMRIVDNVFYTQYVKIILNKNDVKLIFSLPLSLRTSIFENQLLLLNGSTMSRY
jgi:hypothetical protein